MVPRLVPRLAASRSQLGGGRLHGSGRPGQPLFPGAGCNAQDGWGPALDSRAARVEMQFAFVGRFGVMLVW